MLLAYPIAKLLMFQLCCQNLINAIASGDNAIVSGDNAIALSPLESGINLDGSIEISDRILNT